MHTAILLWGFTAILGKAIQLDEGLLVWYRMLFSAIAMVLFLLAGRKLQPLRPAQLLHVAGIGFVITLHWITFYGAIKASNVSIAISCFSSVALFTALLDPLLKGKRPKASEIGLGLGVMAGIYIIFSVQEYYLKGILLSLASAFLASVFTILNKRISSKIDPSVITFYELGTGFILLTLLLPLWFSINGSNFLYPSGEDLFYLLILSIVCTTFAMTLSLHALQKIDAFTMNLSVNLEPLYSIVLAILIYNEHKMLVTEFYIGSSVILLAVVLHGYFTYKKRSLLQG
ncbi:MAG: EamA family transporter [Bacteroidia bacterium]|nr:EamA family transporter [Bacteroidia bacterium]